MGQRKSKSSYSNSVMDLMSLKPKNNPIKEDYSITRNKLGVGISGSVVLCYDRITNQEFALKVKKKNNFLQNMSHLKIVFFLFFRFLMIHLKRDVRLFCM